ncbi:MAG: hypothetical protein JPMHGGIA_00920 [Saprospiraceae bacterium]|jgi:hypothetical protein|nr:hypothetical protein [Saprospiraceae bacterium]
MHQSIIDAQQHPQDLIAWQTDEPSLVNSCSGIKQFKCWTMVNLRAVDLHKSFPLFFSPAFGGTGPAVSGTGPAVSGTGPVSKLFGHIFINPKELGKPAHLVYALLEQTLASGTLASCKHFRYPERISPKNLACSSAEHLTISANLAL